MNGQPNYQGQSQQFQQGQPYNQQDAQWQQQVSLTIKPILQQQGQNPQWQQGQPYNQGQTYYQNPQNPVQDQRSDD